jgi:hypothetical protein
MSTLLFLYPEFLVSLQWNFVINIIINNIGIINIIIISIENVNICTEQYSKGNMLACTLVVVYKDRIQQIW